MTPDRTGLQGCEDKRRRCWQGFRKMAFPYWML